MWIQAWCQNSFLSRTVPVPSEYQFHWNGRFLLLRKNKNQETSWELQKEMSRTKLQRFRSKRKRRMDCLIPPSMTMNSRRKEENDEGQRWTWTPYSYVRHTKSRTHRAFGMVLYVTWRTTWITTIQISCAETTFSTVNLLTIPCG
jgi:hypothetical protein